MSSGQPGASSSGGAGSGTGNAARMSKYKNAGLDTQELRRRRTCSWVWVFVQYYEVLYITLF